MRGRRGDLFAEAAERDGLKQIAEHRGGSSENRPKGAAALKRHCDKHPGHVPEASHLLLLVCVSECVSERERE